LKISQVNIYFVVVNFFCKWKKAKFLKRKLEANEKGVIVFVGTFFKQKKKGVLN